MSYSICGLVVRAAEEAVCARHKWPFVSLAAGVSIMPLERDYLFLTAGDATSPEADFEFVVPQWLSDIVSCFSSSAYIEAEFWGGTGMQASIVFAAGQIVDGPVISSAAINFALRNMVTDDERSIAFLGMPVSAGKDPFDMVGLGRHRSVSGWLRESAEQGAAGTSRRAEQSNGL
jgi:hypothetical protein